MTFLTEVPLGMKPHFNTTRIEKRSFKRRFSERVPYSGMQFGWCVTEA